MFGRSAGPQARQQGLIWQAVTVLFRDMRDLIWPAKTLFPEPFVIEGSPETATAPLVFSSAHSGRDYPAGFCSQTQLEGLALRASEDAFVDLLFASAPGQGAILQTARFPRSYCDVNRERGEIDPGLFDGALPPEIAAVLNTRSPRVEAGLGVIPKVVREGVDIYRAKLPVAEIVNRLAALHEPWHESLALLLAAMRARFGGVVLIDCHSMPSAPPGTNGPGAHADVVIGDRFGASAPRAIVLEIERAFAGQGFSIARNTPYAGGHTVERHAKRGGGIFAVQVEMRRSIYMDEAKVAPHAGFAAVESRIARVISTLAAMRWPFAAPSREAAE